MKRKSQDFGSSVGRHEPAPDDARLALKRWRRAGRIAPAVALTFLTILAASPATAQTAEGNAAVPPDGPFDGLLRTLDLKAKPATAPAPDFVRKSRPATSEFVPVGRQHPERPGKVMTPAEVEAETNALDKDRVVQQRRAGIKPPPVPLKPTKPVAVAPKTKDR